MKLLIEDDEGKKTAVPFAGDEITIGRQEQGNKVHLPERNVSRRHARMVVMNDVVFIEDLGSSNGTRVNGERIQGRRKIRTGDLIQIGDYDLAIQEGAEEQRSAAAAAAPTISVPAQAPPPGSAARPASPPAPPSAAARAPAAPLPRPSTKTVSAVTEPAFPAMAAPPSQPRPAEPPPPDRSKEPAAPARLAEMAAHAAPVPHEPVDEPEPPPFLGMTRTRLMVAAVSIFFAFAVLGFAVGRSHAAHPATGNAAQAPGAAQPDPAGKAGH